VNAAARRVAWEHCRVHIYCDEAGVSQTEKIAVVAAIILNPYKQVSEVEDAVRLAVCEEIPLTQRNGFIFHAKQICNDRKWSPQEGARKIARWLDILSSTGAIVAISWISKQATVELGLSKKIITGRGHEVFSKEDNNIAHSGAFATCLSDADRFVAECHRDSVATVFAEDCPEMRATLTWVVRESQNPKIGATISLRPHSNIRNGISWVKKESCVPIQLADAVAYSFQRYLNRANHGDFLKWVLFGRPEAQISRDWTTSIGGSLVFSPAAQ